MIVQWTDRQIHDTVAAIARSPTFGGARQSLLGRVFRWLLDRFGDLLELVRGSMDARLVVYAAVALVGLIVIGRIIVDRQLAEQRQRRVRAGGRGERRDYAAMANELAAQGRYVDASHALYAAVLEAMSTAGAIRYHASKTGGEYARELRRRGLPSAADFRAFVRDFDRAVYGGATLGADDFTRMSAIAGRLLGARRGGAAA